MIYYIEKLYFFVITKRKFVKINLNTFFFIFQFIQTEKNVNVDVVLLRFTWLMKNNHFIITKKKKRSIIKTSLSKQNVLFISMMVKLDVLELIILK